ncbi:MAG: PEP-utilizing enzyme, partial [Rhizobacter sp.]
LNALSRSANSVLQAAQVMQARDFAGEDPLVLVASDISPADMLQFKKSVFAGFVTDVGGKTSHTAIVARSLDIPAVVGARSASHLVRQDDWVIIDGDAGVMIVDPSPIILAEYGFKQRQGDLEQVVERLLHRMKGTAAVLAPSPPRRKRTADEDDHHDLFAGDAFDAPLVLIAHDLSPADMLQFKKSVFAGFVTDVGGRTSHTAIIARSMDIPAVVGARSASQLVRQDDWVVIDGDAGVMIVDPSPIILAEYGFKQRQGDLERGRLSRLRHKPAVTLDGQRVDLLAN